MAGEYTDVGTPDALRTIASGIAAQVPAGIAGLVDYFRQAGHARALRAGKRESLDRARERAAKTVDDTAQAFTMEPRTQEGAETLAGFGQGVERLGEAAMKVPGAPTVARGWQDFTAAAPLLAAGVAAGTELMPGPKGLRGAIPSVLRKAPSPEKEIERIVTANYAQSPNVMTRAPVRAFLKEAQNNPDILEYGLAPDPRKVQTIEDMLAHYSRAARLSEPMKIDVHPYEQMPGTSAIEDWNIWHPKAEGPMRVTHDPPDPALVDTEDVGHGQGAGLMYQALYNDASNQGYKIMSQGLSEANEYRLLPHVLANIVRTGKNPRDVSGTAAGRASRLEGYAQGPEVWRALAEETKLRMGETADRVMFDGENFRVNGKVIEPTELGNALRWSRGDIERTRVGDKSIKKMAVFDWLREADPEDAMRVAEGWDRRLGPLFGVGAVGLGLGAGAREEQRVD